MNNKSIDTKLNNHLKSLADKYEKEEFLVGDPSWFMHQVEGDTNKELLAFIASSLSYGSRKQFLPKIQKILDASKGNVKEWLISGQYILDIPENEECYYRLYTNKMMHDMLNALAAMVKEYGSMKEFVSHLSLIPEKGDAFLVIEALCKWFNDHGSKGIIPKNTQSSCKRICMFLRWMVRDNSPVDIGLWNDIIDKRTLIIPMDTHVVQEAMRLGLLTSKSTSMSTAKRLTERLKEIFPDDPTKGDFALFGLGVDEN